jgi:hypothetical protein
MGGLQLVLSKTNKIGDTKYNTWCSTLPGHAKMIEEKGKEEEGTHHHDKGIPTWPHG